MVPAMSAPSPSMCSFFQFRRSQMSPMNALAWRGWMPFCSAWYVLPDGCSAPCLIPILLAIDEVAAVVEDDLALIELLFELLRLVLLAEREDPLRDVVERVGVVEDALSLLRSDELRRSGRS